jgi:hypothetical protein
MSEQPKENAPIEIKLGEVYTIADKFIVTQEANNKAIELFESNNPAHQRGLVLKCFLEGWLTERVVDLVLRSTLGNTSNIAFVESTAEIVAPIFVGREMSADMNVLELFEKEGKLSAVIRVRVWRSSKGKEKGLLYKGTYIGIGKRK